MCGKLLQSVQSERLQVQCVHWHHRNYTTMYLQHIHSRIILSRRNHCASKRSDPVSNTACMIHGQNKISGHFSTIHRRVLRTMEQINDRISALVHQCTNYKILRNPKAKCGHEAEAVTEVTSYECNILV